MVSRYVCPIAGVKGQSAGFLRTVVARNLGRVQRVLYLGDHDRSGYDIERNVRSVLIEEQALNRVHERDFDFKLDWQRLAMSEELVEEHEIDPIWKVDGRDGEGHWAVEVESLGQANLVALVRQALDDLLPEPLEHVREREREEQRAWLARLDGGGGT